MEDYKAKKSVQPRVLMFGPSLNATSGISNVVNNWLEVGLSDKVDLKYISTLKHYVHGRFFQKTLEAIYAYVQMLKIKREKFDIVHIHFSTGMSLYRKLILFKIAIVKGFKIIIHLHASNFKEYYSTSNLFRKKLIEHFFNQSNLVFVLSESWQDYCKQFCSKDKIKILYNGASTDKFQGKITNDTKINITSMGRLGKRKGTYDLIQAFERLCPENKKIKLILGGDGDVDRVKNIAVEKKIEDRIDVLGWVSGTGKIDVFKNADIYVLPSYNEGLPGSVLEAMAVGTPIISTNVGGIPELVKPGINGYLIKPGDLDSLYNKLKKLVESRKLREEMGKQSRLIIKEKFEIELIVQQLVQFYQQVMSKPARYRKFSPKKRPLNCLFIICSLKVPL